MNLELVNECFQELKDVKRKIKSYSKSTSEQKDNFSKLSHVNLEQYLKLRSMNITDLQEKLVKLGLSTLGRSQPHILDTINQVLIILAKFKNEEYNEIDNPLDYDLAMEIISHRLKIYGFKDESYLAKTKIMVTLPSSASIDGELIEDLCLSGADILRINSAHDGSQAWVHMAQKIKQLNKDKGLETMIYFDLAGPKIRTTSLEKFSPPIKIGSKKEKTLIHLVCDSHQTTKEAIESSIAKIVVSEKFLHSCKKGHSIHFVDCLEKKRELEILEVSEDLVVCQAHQKSYINSNVVLKLKSKKIKTNIYNLRKIPIEIRLFNHEKILIKTDLEEGYLVDPSDGFDYKAVIGCSSKDVFKYVKVEDRVFIDDGKIECKVIHQSETEILCEVIRSKDNGVVVKEEKGINFPDSDLQLEAVTDEDFLNLKAVLDYVDMIGISFCQTKKDIESLEKFLMENQKSQLGIIAKIETQKSVANLPEILKALIQHNNSGIMIARGDLAIEVGFENLSVLQEEILNLCEAAHIPVIYATQVLENKMKTNLPSRAEITDAAFAQRADCIMLNKGIYAVDTIKILKTILRQMHKLFKKNRQLLTIAPHWTVKDL
jgi:pyruvate kinase